ncbi:MAG: DUF2029 domain-containing protein [Chloroflexota bacterium]|nr:DUF2029 domain-containing protein [Chloroflexota bacterium]
MIASAGLDRGGTAARSASRQPPPPRLMAWLPAMVLLGIVLLGLMAPVRRTGDTHQYLAMADAISHLRQPALTNDEVAEFSSWLLSQSPEFGFASAVRAMRQPNLVANGRQEFSHFWLFPLLASPFVYLVRLLGLHEGIGFIALNALLMYLALRAISRHVHPVVALLLLASPLVWFINKAQVEVFTVAFLCFAVVEARRGRFLWAALAGAVASTQNVPILATVPCFWAAGVLSETLSCGRPALPRPTIPSTAIIAATLLFGALHPVYYLSRLGVLTPQRLNGGIDLSLPSWSRYMAVLIDPDIGLLAWAPHLVLIALAGAVILAMDRRRSANPHERSLYLCALCSTLLIAWFLFAFAQTTNVNSGGTYHVSRYALWLIPLLIPFFEVTVRFFEPRLGLTLMAGALAAVVAFAILFSPNLPERYVTPSPQSALMASWFPGLYRQVPEVFYERHRGIDGAALDWAANGDCTVMLVSHRTPAPSCPLTTTEADRANHHFAAGWKIVWIIRPGQTPLHRSGVFGAIYDRSWDPTLSLTAPNKPTRGITAGYH